MSTEHAPQPPAGRYGSTPAGTRRRRTQGLVAVLTVLGLLTTVWLGAAVLRDPVQWKDVGYDVVDGTAVDVTFEVTQTTGTSAVCRVQALSQSYAEVGVLDVTVPRGSTATQRVTVTVPTTELAVTGTVEGCDVLEAP